MKTIKELNSDILKVSTTICEMLPELTKYINEIPLRILEPFSHSKDIDHLQDYYDSLNSLLSKYAIDHVPVQEDVSHFQKNRKIHHQYGF